MRGVDWQWEDQDGEGGRGRERGGGGREEGGGGRGEVGVLSLFLPPPLPPVPGHSSLV